LALFVALSSAARSEAARQLNCWVFLALVNLIVFGAGVWASGRVSLLMRTADPGRVVIDEISGQLISLTPLLLAPTWLSVLLGFVLFRAFDILKPFPINKLERLPGGWGIMADDAGAGILTAAILLAVRLARLA